jgi:hypothetical protein
LTISLRASAAASILAGLVLAGCAATPLHDAAEIGDIGQINALLAQGADIEARDDGIDKRTPLMYAVGSNQREAVKALLEDGANPFAVGNGGTAYAVAHNRGLTDIAQFIAAYSDVPGIALAEREGQIIVSFVNSGSPAEKAGITGGEKLIAIDELVVQGLPIRKARAKLHKAATLTVLRPSGTAPVTLTVGAVADADRGELRPSANEGSPREPSVPAAAAPWWTNSSHAP